MEIYEEDNSPAQCRIYNMESQTYPELNIQKRIRYYQAKKDSKGLKAGEKKWGRLPDLYIIIYFNTTGKKCVARAKKLLTYLNHSNIESVTNKHVAHIHDYVIHVKQSTEVRERYMTIGEMMDRSKAEGLAEGLTKGERIGRINLVRSMLGDLGSIPEEFQARLETADEATLVQWMKHAARAESLQEFLEQIGGY